MGDSLSSIEKPFDEKTISALKTIIEEISKKYNISPNNILYSIEKEFSGKKEILGREENLLAVPVTIFKKDYGYLQALCAYSKDVLKIPFSKIAKILNRDQRTIWVSYTNFAGKKDLLKLEATDTFIPLHVFSDRKFSPFENLVKHLLEKYSLKEIAAILGIDYKTVWTAKRRVWRKENEK